MKTIHHVLEIDAPARAVWAALTEPARLAGWWSTKLAVDGSGAGSRQHWSFAGDFNPVLEVLAIEDGQQVEWACVAGHPPWQDSRFRFQALLLASSLRFF